MQQKKENIFYKSAQTEITKYMSEKFGSLKLSRAALFMTIFPVAGIHTFRTPGLGYEQTLCVPISALPVFWIRLALCLSWVNCPLLEFLKKLYYIQSSLLRGVLIKHTPLGVQCVLRMDHSIPSWQLGIDIQSPTWEQQSIVKFYHSLETEL